MRRQLLSLIIAIAGGLTIYADAFASEPLDALGYRYPKSFLSLKNLRPHYDDEVKAVVPADQPVPRNWVVVGHRRTHLQLSSTTHMLIVQKIPTRPGAELSIWNAQPIPAGWAVVEEFYSPQFPGCKKNALRIRNVSNGYLPYTCENPCP